MSIEKQVTAMMVFEDEVKAKIFGVMIAGGARDGWLDKQIEFTNRRIA